MEQEPKTCPNSFSPPVGKLASEDGAVVICNDNGEEDNKGKIKTDDNVETVVESTNDKLTEEEPRMFLLSNNGTLCLEFLEDQGREDNFTDLDLICCDGYIQVHRCLLMGASKFLRDLLIEKDIMDTTAITLPDITVRHLRQALGLLYTGKTLIDECDEVEVFETMNALGLPVSGLLCRTAKLNDMNQIALLRHNLADDGICLKEVGEDENIDEKSIDKEKSEENTMVTNEKQQNTTELLDTGGDDVQGNVELGKDPMLIHGGVNDEDFLQQITSTTGDVDSPNDLVPASQDVPTGNFKSEEFQDGVNKNSNQYKTKPNGDVQTDNNHIMPTISKKEDDREENLTSANDDGEEIEKNQESLFTNSSHSIISDQEDLNFEAACNDLQKQVAKPITPSENTTLTATGHEMKLRKRKTNEPAEESKLSTDVKFGARSDAIKRKKTTQIRRKNRNTTNGTNSDGDDESGTYKRGGDNTTPENTRDKFPNRVYGTKSEKSETTSQQKRKLSTCSSTTDSNGTAAPFSRVFLEVKEFNGIKYNIYGLMDSEKGIQSGKTIAIMTSKDKSTATNVKI